MNGAVYRGLVEARASEPQTVNAIARGIDAADARVIALFRCVLALTAFWIVLFDPSRPFWLSALTYLSFIAYCVYSVVLAWFSYRQGWPQSPRVLHWIDVTVFAYLLVLTNSSNEIFFQFFFYSILVASFSNGFREGLIVTLAALVLFFLALVFSAPWKLQVSPGELLVHAFYVFFFGIVIAYFGGRKHLSMLRLGLLRQINDQLNPRFGVDHVNEANLGRLLRFYDADSCILALRRPAPDARYDVYSVFRGGAPETVTRRDLDETVAGALLRPLPDAFAGFYHDPEGLIRQRLRGYYSYDHDLRRGDKGFRFACAGLANLMDTPAFITVPYVEHGGTIGRLFITSSRGVFSESDIDFLLQVSSTMATVVENMRLVEELVARAAEHERALVSRDLHDTTIQPYIGLKLALEALQRDAGEANTLSGRIADMISMTEMTIRDLRGYAATLRERAMLPGEFLVDAVKRQVERMARFYGIEVELKSSISPQLTGRLAAEAYQIIAEGLSNILRHTKAKHGFVNILCDNSCLLLKLGNEVPQGGGEVTEFTPKSIRERSRLLGGDTVVERRDDGYTIVSVTIPI